jgi:hypothetical protein
MPTVNPSQKANIELANTLSAILSMDRQDGGEIRMYYRPSFRRITGSTNAAILLSQIWYMFGWRNYKPFYKFIKPCSHPLYKVGDSWTEVMEWSYEEFSTAIKKIGKKVTSGSSKKQLYQDSIVVYWTDANQVTWFDMNLINFASVIRSAYQKQALDDSALSSCLQTLQIQIAHESRHAELPDSKDFIPKEKIKYLLPTGGGSGIMPSAYCDSDDPDKDDQLAYDRDTIEQHPMAIYFKKAVRRYRLTVKMKQVLLRSIWIVDANTGTRIALPNLLWHWINEPGFEAFVIERVQELIDIGQYYEPINLLINLTNFEGRPTEDNPLGKVGWLAWKELNLTRCDLESSYTQSDPASICGPDTPRYEEWVAEHFGSLAD